ncbi:YncE family protein [Methylohalobius crimeensis]|uniref:YncE family protein n=1 Tax=Methylohalobius crimeensis TaxID=244365 RepID=UPI0003B6DBCD|nr:YncE family protein [Methylohalobius crimeensis]
MSIKRIFIFLIAGLSLTTGPVGAEILAMVNYESKRLETPKGVTLFGMKARREGIAIMDVDPKSPRFGKILVDIPLNPEWEAHHIFYDKSMRKAYVVFLRNSQLGVIEMDQFPYRMDLVDLPQCAFAEDISFSDDNQTWYVTCMDGDKVVVGDAATDRVTATIKTAAPYPHGFAINNRIDRALATSTINATDMSKAGEALTVIQPSTNEVLGTVKVSDKESPSGVAPVEVLFVPASEPATAYVANMYGGTLWALTWRAQSKTFEPRPVFDFGERGFNVPLEIYFNDKGDRLFVTTAKPGHLHIFDLSEGLLQPKLLHSIPAAEGAHHVAFTKDWRYAFVQNSLLNLEGMRDGEITVVDLTSQEVVARIDTLKKQDLLPNSIVLLPQWNHLAGH